MLFCFRCDASSSIGLGHISRCFALADALGEFNVFSVFIMGDPSLMIKSKFDHKPHRLLTLPKPKDSEFNEVEDANNSYSLLKNSKLIPDLFIVDHYQLTSLWWIRFRSDETKIMVLNDSMNKVNDVDFIWDIGSTIKNEKKVKPSEPIHFYGPEYALLRKEFREADHVKKLTDLKQYIRVLICIGATDPKNTSELLINWILQYSITTKITLVTTSLNPNLKHIQQAFYDNPQVNCIIDSENIANVMMNNDISISAAGNIMWESFSLGIPCLIIKNDENQQRNINIVKANIPELYLGYENELNKNTIIEQLDKWVKSPNKLLKASKNVQQLCDGKGCERVANRLMESFQ